MSNQQKAEFVNGIFCIQTFRGVDGKILPKARFVPKGQADQISPIQQPGQVLMALTVSYHLGS
jgi:hypothetical protein